MADTTGKPKPKSAVDDIMAAETKTRSYVSQGAVALAGSAGAIYGLAQQSVQLLNDLQQATGNKCGPQGVNPDDLKGQLGECNQFLYDIYREEEMRIQGSWCAEDDACKDPSQIQVPPSVVNASLAQRAVMSATDPTVEDTLDAVTGAAKWVYDMATETSNITSCVQEQYQKVFSTIPVAWYLMKLLKELADRVGGNKLIIERVSTPCGDALKQTEVLELDLPELWLPKLPAIPHFPIPSWFKFIENIIIEAICFMFCYITNKTLEYVIPKIYEAQMNWTDGPLADIPMAKTDVGSYISDQAIEEAINLKDSSDELMFPNFSSPELMGTKQAAGDVLSASIAEVRKFISFLQAQPEITQQDIIFLFLGQADGCKVIDTIINMQTPDQKFELTGEQYHAITGLSMSAEMVEDVGDDHGKVMMKDLYPFFVNFGLDTERKIVAFFSEMGKFVNTIKIINDSASKICITEPCDVDDIPIDIEKIVSIANYLCDLLNPSTAIPPIPIGIMMEKGGGDKLLIGQLELLTNFFAMYSKTHLLHAALNKASGVWGGDSQLCLLEYHLTQGGPLIENVVDSGYENVYYSVRMPSVLTDSNTDAPVAQEIQLIKNYKVVSAAPQEVAGKVEFQFEEFFDTIDTSLNKYWGPKLYDDVWLVGPAWVQTLPKNTGLGGNISFINKTLDFAPLMDPGATLASRAKVKKLYGDLLTSYINYSFPGLHLYFDKQAKLVDLEQRPNLLFSENIGSYLGIQYGTNKLEQREYSMITIPAGGPGTEATLASINSKLDNYEATPLYVKEDNIHPAYSLRKLYDEFMSSPRAQIDLSAESTSLDEYMFLKDSMQPYESFYTPKVAITDSHPCCVAYKYRSKDSGAALVAGDDQNLAFKLNRMSIYAKHIRAKRQKPPWSGYSQYSYLVLSSIGIGPTSAISLLSLLSPMAAYWKLIDQLRESRKDPIEGKFLTELKTLTPSQRCFICRRRGGPTGRGNKDWNTELGWSWSFLSYMIDTFSQYSLFSTLSEADSLPIEATRNLGDAAWLVAIRYYLNCEQFGISTFAAGDRGKFLQPNLDKGGQRSILFLNNLAKPPPITDTDSYTQVLKAKLWENGIHWARQSGKIPDVNLGKYDSSLKAALKLEKICKTEGK